MGYSLPTLVWSQRERRTREIRKEGSEEAGEVLGVTDKTEWRQWVTSKKKKRQKKRKVFPKLLNVMWRRGWGTVTVWKDVVSRLTAKEKKRGEESWKTQRKLRKDLLQNLQSATSVNLRHKADRPNLFLSLSCRLAVFFCLNACGATAHMYWYFSGRGEREGC